MLTSQCVLGVGIVIELGLPVSHPVAGLTAVTQCAAMFVVLAVATNTGRLHAFVFTRDMTGRALHFYVTAKKLKFGFLVVVEANIGPLADTVAGFALCPQPPLVNVVFLMTAVTHLRCFTKLLSGNMAGLALHGFMCAIQPEFSQTVMPERLLVKRGNTRRAALVISVTGATCCTLLSAVQAAFLLQITANVFVTIDTQFVLSRLVKRNMATLALFLHFGMSTNDLTRHKSSFE